MNKEDIECDEHELILTDENWMGKNSVMIIMECQKCKSKFNGLMIKE